MRTLLDGLSRSRTATKPRNFCKTGEERRRLIAPTLFVYEATNALAKGMKIRPTAPEDDESNLDRRSPKSHWR